MVCREFRVEFTRKAYKWLRGHREAWSIVDEAVKELRVNPSSAKSFTVGVEGLESIGVADYA